MNDKKDLLSIGEVAETIRVTRRMIINYEKHGLIFPDIKDGTLGNRYYSVDALTRIRTIRVFQDMGLSLDEIYSYLNDTVQLELLIKRLETLRDEITLNIEKLRARADGQGESNIERVMLPAQCIYRKEYPADSVEEKKVLLRAVLLEAVKTYGSDTSRRMFFTEHSYNSPEKVSFCISIPEESTGEYVCKLSKAPALCITFHGGYGELPRLHEMIIKRAKQENIRLTGVCRHTYLEGPPQHRDEHKFITQVAMIIDEQD